MTDDARTRAAERAVRRELVTAFPTFLAYCTRGHAALDTVSQRYHLPPHLLGLLSTGYLARGQGVVTEPALRDSLPYATRSRLGAEHWASLVDAGCARVNADGWIVTDRGMAAVAELYREIRLEISRRAASPALVTVLSEVFETIAHDVPATSRGLAVRQLWSRAEAATTLDRLYRAIWELWIYRDTCFRAAWEEEGYTGPLIDVLSQAWEGATVIEDLVRLLAAKQTHETVLDNVRQLSERGELLLDGDQVWIADGARRRRDAIEDRTDAVYFKRWPIGERLDHVKVDFTALMSELAP